MGQVLNGRYELDAKVGDGGMAVVYQGRDRVLGRVVAVKLLREQFVTDAAFLGRFQREAQSAAALSHPNIVNIYDVGEDHGQHYIVMEYVPGRNLKELIRLDGPMEPATAIDIGQQLCHALSYAHSRGLVHRDIKPQNILVTPEGLVKVADFGIAKGLHDAHLTQTGMAMGTVHYAAPEQVEGKEATPATDIYAAGVVLYEMLTGRLPFEGETPVSIALKHINDAPPRPRSLNSHIPPGLESVVLTALAKEPSERFATAAALATALGSYQHFSMPRAAVARGAARTAAVPVQRTTATTRPSTGRVSLDARPGTATRAAPAARPRRNNGRPRDEVGCVTWIAGVIGLGLLLGLILVAFNALPRLFGGDTAPPPRPSATADGKPTPAGTPSGVPAAITSPSPVVSPTISPTATTTPTPSPSPSPSPSPTATPVPRMPSLIGKTMDEAEQLLKPLNVTVAEVKPGVFSERIPAGRIAEQTPDTGTLIQPGSTVRVSLSRGQPVAIPDLRNQEVTLATKLLTDRGLNVRTIEEGSRDIAATRIIRSEPPAGTQVDGGSTVTLVVSMGDQVQVPDIFGLPWPQARDQLVQAGLKPGTVAEQTREQVPPDQREAFDQVPPGGVLSATPDYGVWVPRGSTVSVAIRKP